MSQLKSDDEPNEIRRIPLTGTDIRLNEEVWIVDGNGYSVESCSEKQEEARSSLAENMKMISLRQKKE